MHDNECKRTDLFKEFGEHTWILMTSIAYHRSTLKFNLVQMGEILVEYDPGFVTSTQIDHICIKSVYHIVNKVQG